MGRPGGCRLKAGFWGFDEVIYVVVVYGIGVLDLYTSYDTIALSSLAVGIQ